MLSIFSILFLVRVFLSRLRIEIFLSESRLNIERPFDAPRQCPLSSMSVGIHDYENGELANKPYSSRISVNLEDPECSTPL